MSAGARPESAVADCTGKARSVPADEHVPARRRADPVQGLRCRDDGATGRHPLQHLVLHAARDPQRSDNDRGARQVGPHVRHGARDLDARQRTRAPRLRRPAGRRRFGKPHRGWAWRTLGRTSRANQQRPIDVRAGSPSARRTRCSRPRPGHGGVEVGRVDAVCDHAQLGSLCRDEPFEQ